MLEISDLAMAKDEKGNIEVACATLTDNAGPWLRN
jgi:hypothetical protein